MKSFIEKSNIDSKREALRQREKRRKYFQQSSNIRTKPTAAEIEALNRKVALDQEIEEIEKRQRERNMEPDQVLIDRAKRAHVSYGTKVLKELFYTAKERKELKASEGRQAAHEKEAAWVKERQAKNELEGKKKYMKLTVLNDDGSQTIYESHTYTKYKGIKVEWGLGGFSNTKKLQNVFFKEFHDQYEKKHQNYFQEEFDKAADARKPKNTVLNKSYRRRVPCYPKNQPPLGLHIPFYQKPSDRYVSAFLKIRQDVKSQFSINLGNPRVPGWLVELSVHGYKILRAIKECLYNMDDLYNIHRPVKLLYYLINRKLKLPVSEVDLCKVLRGIPNDVNNGPSFPHFLFALADPCLALKKGYFMLEPRTICCKYLRRDVYDPTLKEFQFHPVVIGYNKGVREVASIPRPKSKKKTDIKAWEEAVAKQPKRVASYIPVYSMPSDPIIVTNASLTAKSKKKQSGDREHDPDDGRGYEGDSEMRSRTIKGQSIPRMTLSPPPRMTLSPVPLLSTAKPGTLLARLEEQHRLDSTSSFHPSAQSHSAPSKPRMTMTTETLKRPASRRRITFTEQTQSKTALKTPTPKTGTPRSRKLQAESDSSKSRSTSSKSSRSKSPYGRSRKAHHERFLTSSAAKKLPSSKIRIEPVQKMSRLKKARLARRNKASKKSRENVVKFFESRGERKRRLKREKSAGSSKGRHGTPRGKSKQSKKSSTPAKSMAMAGLPKLGLPSSNSMSRERSSKDDRPLLQLSNKKSSPNKSSMSGLKKNVSRTLVVGSRPTSIVLQRGDVKNPILADSKCIPGPKWTRTTQDHLMEYCKEHFRAPDHQHHHRHHHHSFSASQASSRFSTVTNLTNASLARHSDVAPPPVVQEPEDIVVDDDAADKPRKGSKKSTASEGGVAENDKDDEDDDDADVDDESEDKKGVEVEGGEDEDDEEDIEEGVLVGDEVEDGDSEEEEEAEDKKEKEDSGSDKDDESDKSESIKSLSIKSEPKSQLSDDGSSSSGAGDGGSSARSSQERIPDAAAVSGEDQDLTHSNFIHFDESPPETAKGVSPCCGEGQGRRRKSYVAERRRKRKTECEKLYKTRASRHNELLAMLHVPDKKQNLLSIAIKLIARASIAGPGPEPKPDEEIKTEMGPAPSLAALSLSSSSGSSEEAPNQYAMQHRHEREYLANLRSHRLYQSLGGNVELIAKHRAWWTRTRAPDAAGVPYYLRKKFVHKYTFRKCGSGSRRPRRRRGKKVKKGKKEDGEEVEESPDGDEQGPGNEDNRIDEDEITEEQKREQTSVRGSSKKRKRSARSRHDELCGNRGRGPFSSRHRKRKTRSSAQKSSESGGSKGKKTKSKTGGSNSKKVRSKQGSSEQTPQVESYKKSKKDAYGQDPRLFKLTDPAHAHDKPRKKRSRNRSKNKSKSRSKGRMVRSRPGSKKHKSHSSSRSRHRHRHHRHQHHRSRPTKQVDSTTAAHRPIRSFEPPAAPRYNVLKYETWEEQEEKKARFLKFFDDMAISPDDFLVLDYEEQCEMAREHVVGLIQLITKQAFQIKRREEKERVRKQMLNAQKLGPNEKCHLKSKYLVGHRRTKKKTPFEPFHFAPSPDLEDDPAFRKITVEQSRRPSKIQTVTKGHKVIDSVVHQSIVGGCSGKRFEPPRRRLKPTHADKPSRIHGRVSVYENVNRARRKHKEHVKEEARARIKAIEAIVPNPGPKEKKICLRMRDEYDMYKKKYGRANVDEKLVYWTFERHKTFAKPITPDPTPPLSPKYMYPEEIEWAKRQKKKQVEVRRLRRKLMRPDAYKEEKAELLAEQEKELADAKPYPDNSENNTGYSRMEQVFYTGLLLIYMYDLMKELENVYQQNFIDYPIPHKKQADKIHLSNVVGKVGQQTPKSQNTSPYLASFPICRHRLMVQKPNRSEFIRGCRSQTKIKTVHMLARLTNLNEPGKKPEIHVQENRHRIKQALRLLAVKNPVAALPDLHCLVHFTDPLVHVSKNIVRNPEPSKPLNIEATFHSHEMAWIKKAWKDLYEPVGLPPKVQGEMGSHIPFGDLGKMRQLVKNDQNHAWRALISRRRHCRRELYDRMNILCLPQGRVRDMFKQTYKTLLPVKPVMNYALGNASGSQF